MALSVAAETEAVTLNEAVPFVTVAAEPLTVMPVTTVPRSTIPLTGVFSELFILTLTTASDAKR